MGVVVDIVIDRVRVGSDLIRVGHAPVVHLGCYFASLDRLGEFVDQDLVGGSIGRHGEDVFHLLLGCLVGVRVPQAGNEDVGVR